MSRSAKRSGVAELFDHFSTHSAPVVADTGMKVKPTDANFERKQMLTINMNEYLEVLWKKGFEICFCCVLWILPPPFLEKERWSGAEWKGVHSKRT